MLAPGRSVYTPHVWTGRVSAGLFINCVSCWEQAGRTVRLTLNTTCPMMVTGSNGQRTDHQSG